jgi:hypothetical protein
MKKSVLGIAILFSVLILSIIYYPSIKSLASPDIQLARTLPEYPGASDWHLNLRDADFLDFAEITFTTPDLPEQVIDFYSKYLTDQGWRADSTYNPGAEFGHSKPHVKVFINNNEGKRISINVAKTTLPKDINLRTYTNTVSISVNNF